MFVSVSVCARARKCVRECVFVRVYLCVCASICVCDCVSAQASVCSARLYYENDVLLLWRSSSCHPDSPIAPSVLLLLSMPKAMLGRTQAKYRNRVAAAALCGVLWPIIPVR